MTSHDIASILFRDILRFSQYPGSPFTGDILADMVNYFLFPTVFIILFIYIILGVLFTKAQAKFRILVGVTLYLVIIVNGWFSAFALFGQFYIILLLLLGIFYFVLIHFGIRIGGGGSAPEAEVSQHQRKLIKFKSKREKLMEEIEDLEGARMRAKDAAESQRISKEIRKKREELERVI